MKPLIGITAGKVHNRDHPFEPVTFGQLHEYSDAVLAAGGIPVIIPMSNHDDEVKEIFGRLDGFLFAGGNDILPEYYGQSHHDAEDFDDQRDRHEVELMKLILVSNKPILAICRGMQLLNIVRGGTLYQDIADEVPSARNHVGYVEANDHAYLTHTLSIVSESKLAKILGVTKIRSNSRHHQAVKDVGEGLLVNAHAEDGIIEGLEDPDKAFVVGIQAHPEALVTSVQPGWRALFDAFVEAAKKA